MAGVFLAGAAIVLWFFLIFSAPWSAFVGIIMNMLVLYALAVGSSDAWD
jgi:hypothetical protein